MATGNAFKLRYQLAALAQRHKTRAITPVHVPMSAPCDEPMILEDIAASAVTVDLQKMRFRPFAFGLPLTSWDKQPKLLYRHGVEAGKILALSYDAAGSLRARVEVDHVEARRCNAFSVGVTVLSYEIVNEDSADGFHALVTRASLDEISLVESPASPACLVDSRGPVPACVKFFDGMSAAIGKMQQMLALIPRLAELDDAERAAAQAATPPAIVARPPSPSPSTASAAGYGIRSCRESLARSAKSHRGKPRNRPSTGPATRGCGDRAD
jgi:hypothetical protein